ncbi:coagulation factor II (thrombin) receptor-like 1, tandem duplicate 2 [Denticeps clupeoides]|uniref:G-protein coupled receptors family 1 profile domain-containing protein n=1 Tax=Denticeps clupeoides TaxID=299321 RepID=A0AAY4EKZ9_9TELE|nr:proteinase-activated receptor 2-like [Denticeps clupeoides]
MSLRGTSWGLLFLSCVGIGHAQVGSRGFFGTTDEITGEATVDQAARDLLTSNLTTVFFPIIYIFTLAVGLPTNAMAIWVFLFRTKKKHPAAIYMANLALADLLFVIWLPLKIAYHLNGNNWTYGEAMCKVLVGFFYGNMYCSVLFITCLSVQRYWVVAHPLSQQRRNNRLSIVVSVAVWAFVCVSTTPLYLYDQTVKLQDPNVTSCHDVNWIHNVKEPFQDVKHPYYYFMTMAGLVCFLPSVVIIAAYVLLLRALSHSVEDSSSGKKRRKVVVLIIIVLITFLVCFIPSNIMLVIHYALLSFGAANRAYGFYITTLCLSSLNSCLDPIIYYYVSEEFREHVKNTLLCRSNRTVERMRISFNSLTYSKKTNTYTSSRTETSTC